VFIFFSILTLHNLTFSSLFFSNFIMHLTFIYLFVDLDNKVFFVQKALQFKEAIILCYIRLNSIRMNVKISLPLTWHICWIIIDYLGPIVYVCILN
jgi:hypothetical protein